MKLAYADPPYLGVTLFDPASPVSERSSSCARCAAPATAWSGAWVLEDGWIGWCSNECRNAWLKGDKAADFRSDA